MHFKCAVLFLLSSVSYHCKLWREKSCEDVTFSSGNWGQIILTSSRQTAEQHTAAASDTLHNTHTHCFQCQLTHQPCAHTLQFIRIQLSLQTQRPLCCEDFFCVVLQQSADESTGGLTEAFWGMLNCFTHLVYKNQTKTKQVPASDHVDLLLHSLFTEHPEFEGIKCLWKCLSGLWISLFWVILSCNKNGLWTLNLSDLSDLYNTHHATHDLETPDSSTLPSDFKNRTLRWKRQVLEEVLYPACMC